ncbi:MAG: UDP-N-acetylglucosamine 1-carboxyvinyltransferase [Bacteroidota bacterium]|nr:UDP-N-acetylglucosamine 1-carboxyvinyltransferase [Candidatus Kapabacteria bacterium]MDW8075466.1 UDP-N-acetylglucosamine 1-carboxyvinyltransferase [Bacteroidota bacterium]
MDKFIIEGGRVLHGTLPVAGSKNAVLALMPATLLAPGIHRIRRTPNLRDVWTMSRLLTTLGAHVELDASGELLLDTRSITCFEAPYEHVKKMRASIYVLGPLLARYGQARVSLPGGCAFGPRPVDLHLKGMEKLGAEVTIEHGYIIARASRLRGAKIHLDFPSVGATVNILYAASLAEGDTILTNAAIEPEVTALARMLVAMGAQIEGIGTSTLHIHGVPALEPAATIENIPDRIEAATLLIGAAMTRGTVRLTEVNPYHLGTVLDKLEQVGCTLDVNGNTIELQCERELSPVDVITAPYPGFPTDVQAQWAALMLTVNGTARVTDTIYPTRFGYVPELQRLGAHVEVVDNTAIVHGGSRLQGATVMSSDLRASASLVLAGLVAEGRTEVLRIYHLDRGYERMEVRLRQLGAQIERVQTDEF